MYKQWVKVGGYNYPAKALNLRAQEGYNRLILSWEKPKDPAVKHCVLYWNDRRDSLSFDYSQYPSGTISAEVNNLEDRSYTFNVINTDNEGNRSLASELIVGPYGQGWLSSRTERTITRAIIDGSDALIQLTRSTNEMISTRFRYKNLSNEWVEYEVQLSPGQNEIRLPRALKGKRFEISSAFCPVGGIDTVWREWMKSSDAISYPLSGSRWTKSATKGQILDGTSLEYIFDGIDNSAGSRWHSSRTADLKTIFPKIISIDTRASVGEEFAFTGFTFCQNTNTANLRYIRNCSIYVGSEPYNPDSKDFQAEFGIPFLAASVSTNNDKQTVFATSGKTGRYLSLVFLNSWDTTNGYVDLWELIPYGYIPSQAD